MANSASDLNDYLARKDRDLFGDPFRERVFPAAEYLERQRRFRVEMASAGVDVVVATAPDTMAWLHGYRSRWYRQHTSTQLPPAQCTVIETGGGGLFVIEAAYHEELVQATSLVEDIRCVGTGMEELSLDGYVEFLLKQLGSVSDSPMRVGLELWSCVPSPAMSRIVESALEAAGHVVVDVSLNARSVRHVKSQAEIVALERAQSSCDAGLLAVRDRGRIGMTELEAWAIYIDAVVGAGGEPAALHETVAAGPLMPSAHRLSSRAPILAGRVFHCDASASWHGYHARATRPYVAGPAEPELRELTAIAAGAFDVLLQVGQVGTPWQELFAALADYYAGTGIEGSAAGYEMGITVPPADWVNEFVWAVDRKDIQGSIEAGRVSNFESWNVLALVDLVVFEESGPRLLSGVPHEIFELQR